jgi:hypothetical protein
MVPDEKSAKKSSEWLVPSLSMNQVLHYYMNNKLLNYFVVIKLYCNVSIPDYNLTVPPHCSADKLVPIFRHSPYRDHFTIFGLYFTKLVPILPK